MLNAVLQKFKNIPEEYQRKISLDNMVNVNTGFLNIEFYANKDYSPEQDKHIINETSQYINILLKEQYTDNSLSELYALISAELRGGMIFIAQLLEDAQFLREWEERNKFRPYFSMSLNDTFERHSFLFKIFDTNPLYLLQTEDLKQIDEQIKINSEKLTRFDAKVNDAEIKKFVETTIAEYKKDVRVIAKIETEYKLNDIKLDDLNIDDFNMRMAKLAKLQNILDIEIPILNTYNKLKKEYMELLQKNIRELNNMTDLDKHKYLLKKVLDRHIEEQKKFNILSQFKYSLEILQSINTTNLNRFKIVRTLMDPKYDNFSIENIVKIIIAEFNILIKSDINPDFDNMGINKHTGDIIEQYVNIHRSVFIDEELKRKELITKRLIDNDLPRTQLEFDSLFLRIIKEEGYLNIKISKLNDSDILNFYNTRGLYDKLQNKTDMKDVLIQIIRYIFIQPAPYKKPNKQVFTYLEPFEKINYYENLRSKFESEGYLNNITAKRFDEIMDHIIENILLVKNSRYQTSSNKTLLIQLRAKKIIGSDNNISNYDKFISYIEEYVIIETNILLNDMFLYKSFASLGYIAKSSQSNKLTSLDDIFSLYDLLSINNKLYSFDTSLLDMLNNLPDVLQPPDNPKLEEYILKMEEYNKPENKDERINILFFIITQTKQLLMGDRITLLKYYSKDNNHVYYNIYPVTRQPTNISGLLIKLFAHNNTFAHNKYPICVMFPENSDYLYENTFYTDVLKNHTFIGVMCINIKNNPKYILIYKKIYDLTKLPEYKFATPTEIRYDLLTLVDPSLFHLISINSADFRLKNFENPMNMVIDNGVVRPIPTYYVENIMHTKTSLFTKLPYTDDLKKISEFNKQLTKPIPKKMLEQTSNPIQNPRTSGNQSNEQFWRKTSTVNVSANQTNRPKNTGVYNQANVRSWRDRSMLGANQTNNPANVLSWRKTAKISGGYKHRYEMIKNDYIKL